MPIMAPKTAPPARHGGRRSEEAFGAVSLSEKDPEKSGCHIALSSATAGAR